MKPAVFVGSARDRDARDEGASAGRPSGARRRAAADLLLAGGVLLVVAAAVLPIFATSDHVNLRGDYLQYAARHEHLRRALLEHGTLPQRTHLVGGGYPILGDPEDPTFNPTSLLTLAFGTITGIKLIGLLAMLASAAGLYAFMRSVLRLPRIAAAGAALAAGLSLWIPVRMMDGNPNEVCYGFLPLALLLLARTDRRRLALVGLALLFGAMLSDGKLAFVASMLYLGVLALCALVPGLELWPVAAGDGGARTRPLRMLALAAPLAAGLFLFRILPALEVIDATGSLARMGLWFHADTYGPRTIAAYTPSRLVSEAVGLAGFAREGTLSSVLIGPFTLLLALFGVLGSWRRALPWALTGGLFAWLALAHRAPVDLFELVWHLPLINAIDAPAKYFSGPVVLSTAVLAGYGCAALMRWSRLGKLWSLVLIGGTVAFLFPRVWDISDRTYTSRIPPDELVPAETFHQVRSDNLPRGRVIPYASNTYVNMLRGVGTIDWYTGIPLPEVAIPRYVIEADGMKVPLPGYRGECFWRESGESVPVEIAHHRMVAAPREPAAGTLVFNQSFHPDWRTDVGRLVSWRGLLAVELRSPVTRVELRYASGAFRLGAILSAAIALLAGFVGWLEVRGVLARRAARRSGPGRHVARLLRALLR